MTGPACAHTDLEALYRHYNRREFVHPDPLEFLYNYHEPADRETAGLIAASLAYGNVKQILKAVASVLGVMGKSPAGYLEKRREAEIRKDFAAFKYRFTTGEQLANFLRGMKGLRREYGSLEKCFMGCLPEHCGNLCTAQTEFARRIYKAGGDISTLMPNPERGSAFKRLNLYLRWMVRRDAVDPGGWDGVSPSLLIVPLDTHMHRIGKALCLTKRNQADLKTALEITRGFAAVSPKDPVKYDFCLTRFGIRDEIDLSDLRKRLNLG